MAKPWTNGPRELIKHAISHLHQKSNDFDLRIAFISIDNSVEVMIKTYLGLPKRIRGNSVPSRRELESAFGFPDILDLLEKYTPEHLNGIELAEIEWYHRIRNSLYHEGNGITVEKKHVETYLGLSKILFENLFEEKFQEKRKEKNISPNEVYLEKWLELERRLRTLALNNGLRKVQYIPPAVLISKLNEMELFEEGLYKQIQETMTLRNSLAHGLNLGGLAVPQEMIKIQNIIKKLPDWRK